MPRLAELRRDYDRSRGASTERSGTWECETVEVDARSGLSPSEMVERKLQATLSAKREGSNPPSALLLIPR